MKSILYTFLFVALVTPTTSVPEGCDDITPSLPESCGCRDGRSPHSIVVECTKVFNSSLWNDTVGILLSLEPCHREGSRMSINVTDAAEGIDFAVSKIEAGTDELIPIPGLSIAVPGLGHAGVDLEVRIAGTPDALLLKVGLNACIKIRSRFVCADWIPGLNEIFPWWILQGNYSFGDYCQHAWLMDEFETENFVSVV